MKRLLMILLMICLTLPAMAEASEASETPECWIVSYECLTDFMQAWSEDVNGAVMLDLCAPSWKAQQTDPELALFLLVHNREAEAWSIGQPVAEGTDRLYDVDVLIDDFNSREPRWYRFTFRLVLAGGVRYVDPKGLRTGEVTEEPENYTLPEMPPAEQPGSWWHEAGAWNHAGDPEL